MASDLAVAAGKTLLARQSFKPTDIAEVIMGCVMPSGKEANIARLIGLRLGTGDRVPAWTVARNCASGLQAIDCAAMSISAGISELVLAGGTEAMSRAPLLFSEGFINWIADFKSSPTFQKKLLQIVKFKPQFLAPVIALLQGLSDPLYNLSMGQTAEKLMYQFGISRVEADTYAAESHIRALRAQKELGDELTPLFDYKGNVIEFDNGIRQDSTVERLAKLRPVFDKPFGQVTAGNSSQISDGAAMLLLASEAAVKKYNLPILGRIIDVKWAALNPSIMGLGPVHAISKLLQTNNLGLKDLDYWEINEAFAAQVLACRLALNNKEYCQKELHVDQAYGELELNRLNVEGGAIAIGHPVGASGARLVLHLLKILQKKSAKRGIASLCIGGGQGGAILLESMS